MPKIRYQSVIQLTTNTITMNDAEISEIKKTWKIPMQTPNESGQAILIQFFTKYPSNLQKFNAFKECPVAQLKDNVRFKAHAGRIVKVFNESINILGVDYCHSALEDMWVQIAKTHFKRQISKQAFNELKEVILEVLSAACQMNETQQKAWIKLLDCVYAIIFKALDELSKQ